MPLPWTRSIFSSSVMRPNTRLARSSGESVLSNQGKFGFWSCAGGCAKAVPSENSDNKIAKQRIRVQNRLFIGDLPSSVHEFFTYHDTSRWRVEIGRAS